MSAPVRSVRLSEFHTATLDRNTYASGEVFYDVDERTLRVMNGKTKAGATLLRSDLANLEPTALNKTLNLGTGTITANHIYGPLTGNVTGNLTGNVTGNLTGNADTATKLATARRISGVLFDGTADIDIPSSTAETIPGTSLNSTILTSSLTTVGTLTNLTVTNTITGSINGNAATATKLAATKTINGVAFDGSTNITVAADANTLTNTILNDTVVTSSLTSVGILTSVEVAGDITADANVVISTAPTLTSHATNKKYVDKKSAAMAIALG